MTMLKKGWKRVGRFVLPKQEDQLEYYEHYSCMPPPMFMILISVIEVRVSHLFIIIISCNNNFASFIAKSNLKLRWKREFDFLFI